MYFPPTPGNEDLSLQWARGPPLKGPFLVRLRPILHHLIRSARQPGKSNTGTNATNCKKLAVGCHSQGHHVFSTFQWVQIGPRGNSIRTGVDTSDCALASLALATSGTLPAGSANGPSACLNARGCGGVLAEEPRRGQPVCPPAAMPSPLPSLQTPAHPAPGTTAS